MNPAGALRAQTTVSRQLAMLGHPARQCGWRRPCSRGFAISASGEADGKGIAEIIKRDPVEDHAQRICFVAQRRRCRCEHAAAQFALPQLHDLKLLAARAFADEARAAAVRASRLVV
jgi:hypothetical protein